MKKSAFDNIPQTFYVDMKDGRSITFSKEEFPMGVRWLHDNKDVRFYSTEGEEVFPVLQFSENNDNKALMLFEEKDWANDYCGEYTDATGINAVVEFEEFINDVLSDGVYVDYGDEDIMESTKKMAKSWNASIDEDADFIHHVINEGTVINRDFSDVANNGVVVSTYEWDGRKFRVYSYPHDTSFMEEISKMKKSTPTIHDMIAQIRKNNNSLKKEPVGFNRNWAE